MVWPIQLPYGCGSDALLHRGDRPINRSLGEQGAAAQNVRLEVQCEALLCCQYLGRMRALQGYVWLAAKQMDDRLVQIRDIETQRMAKPLSEMHGIANARQRPIGITE